jgi:hypothetical protein
MATLVLVEEKSVKPIIKFDENSEGNGYMPPSTPKLIR